MATDDIQQETLTVTKTVRTIRAHTHDILAWLQSRGVEIARGSQVTATVTVPTGADWSGEELDLAEENELVITITTIVEEKS